MYSEIDLDNAVSAGVLTREAADAFRSHVASVHQAPAVDEEHFRLLSGFNDIFVAIATVLVMVALGYLGTAIAPWVGGLMIAAAAWGLAEYFTRRRRMALPSILLLLAFVGGIGGTLVGIVAEVVGTLGKTGGLMVGAGVALAMAGAAWLHWRRFMVPITVAAGAAALVAVVIALLAAALPEGATSVIFALWAACGVAVFALAMWWDLSDRERRTRRSDVAFWLHLAAAPMIAHPMFHLLGVFDSDMGIGKALVVLALYLVFAAVALAVDRRALLVSGLAYVLYALYALLQTTASLELAWAITGLVIGSALLLLSAFWQPMRRMVVGSLGATGQRLPPVGSPALVTRPA